MASDLDICNLSIAHLGGKPTVASINPPEGSAEAAHCARFYPIARDAVLERHSWRFATRRAVLTPLNITILAPGWQYAYALPNKCLRPLAVLAADATNDTQGQDFLVETLDNDSGVVYTNVPEARMKFIASVVDTTRYSPLAVNTMSWLLASYLSGPITKNPKLKETMYKMYTVEMAQAVAADCNARQLDDPYKNFTPASIESRQ